MSDWSNLRFTSTHEWVRVKGKRIVVGITDFAQQHLSDIVHAELPEPDDHHYEENEDISSIESLKTSIDFHAPVSGRIVAINTALLSQPEVINEEPYEEGWLVEMIPDNMADVAHLMDVNEYEASLPEDEEDEE